MPTTKSDLPSPAQVEKRVKQPGTSVAPSADAEQLSHRQHQAHKQALEIKEIELKLKLRSRWSRFMMYLVATMIFFQMGLFIMVGLEWLTFSDEWIARIVLPGTFAEILGFVYIIITYLFPTERQSEQSSPTSP